MLSRENEGFENFPPLTLKKLMKVRIWLGATAVRKNLVYYTTVELS